MIYNIPTDYCYDRYGDRWDWNGFTWSHWHENSSVWGEHAALNRLAEERGPLTDTPPITVGTVLDTAEKGDACPPFTVVQCLGTFTTAVKTGKGQWVRALYHRTVTSEVIASAPIPYTVIYVPEGDE